MPTVTINGVSFTVPADANVEVRNGRIFVNGAVWDHGALIGGTHNFEVIGGLVSLKVDNGYVGVQGDVRGNLNAAGDVVVHGKVGRSITAGGDVTCGDVEGSIEAGGNVQCDRPRGNIKAGGSVNRG